MANQIVVNTNTYHGFFVEDALHGIAKAGFRAVELCAVEGYTEHLHADMSESELNTITEIAKKLNLQVVALSGHQDIAKDKPTANFLRNMELAKRAGIPLIITGVGEVESDEVEQQLFRNLKKIAVKAEELNLTVGLEIHGNYLSTGRKGNEIIERLGSKRVGLNYDSGNTVFYGDVLPENDLPSCIHNLVYFHLKDKIGGKGVWNFPTIGDGELHIETLKQQAEDGGYNGPVSIELEFNGEYKETLQDVNEAVQRSYHYLKSIGWLRD